MTISAGKLTFGAIGGRETVFDGPPISVYVPAGVRYDVEAHTPVELAICSAPALGHRPVHLIAAEDVGLETRGSGTNLRFVRTSCPTRRISRNRSLWWKS